MHRSFAHTCVRPSLAVFSAHTAPLLSRSRLLQSQRHSSSTGKTSVTEDGGDDFVDIDFLSLASMNTTSTQTASFTAHAGPISSASPSPSATLPSSRASGPAVLGVTRRQEAQEGTEYSRFDIPLEVPRHGQPIPRPGSRAAFKPGEEAHLAEEAQNKKMQKQQSELSEQTSPSREVDSTADAVPTSEEEAVDLAVALADALVKDTTDPTGSGEGFSPLPQPDTSLPYDDEAFAETLLQMEVDGVIDETWQDTRKAHIEDVKEVTEVLRSLKVRDICCIDVSGKTGNFDYMLFGTCEGPRHIHLAAWAAQEADSLKRVSKIPRKKTDELWEVVPIGRIVLNLMVESLRDELTLERKWAVTKSMDPLEAANAPVSEGRNVRAHGLWTLTLNLQDLEDFEVDYCKDVLLRQM